MFSVCAWPDLRGALDRLASAFEAVTPGRRRDPEDDRVESAGFRGGGEGVLRCRAESLVCGFCGRRARNLMKGTRVRAESEAVAATHWSTNPTLARSSVVLTPYPVGGCLLGQMGVD